MEGCKPLTAKFGANLLCFCKCCCWNEKCASATCHCGQNTKLTANLQVGANLWICPFHNGLQTVAKQFKSPPRGTTLQNFQHFFVDGKSWLLLQTVELGKDFRRACVATKSCHGKMQLLWQHVLLNKFAPAGHSAQPPNKHHVDVATNACAQILHLLAVLVNVVQIAQTVHGCRCICRRTTHSTCKRNGFLNANVAPRGAKLLHKFGGKHKRSVLLHVNAGAVNHHLPVGTLCNFHSVEHIHRNGNAIQRVELPLLWKNVQSEIQFCTNLCFHASIVPYFWVVANNLQQKRSEISDLMVSVALNKTF